MHDLGEPGQRRQSTPGGLGPVVVPGKERRHIFGAQPMLRTLKRDGALAEDWTAPRAGDYLWAASSIQAWELLAIDRGWGPAKAERVLRRTLADTVLG